MIAINNVEWPSEEAVESFLSLTNQTCIVALNRTILNCHAYGHTEKQAEFMAYLSSKMINAMREVKRCL